MGKVNRGDYSTAIPVIKPSDIAPAMFANLTCVDVVEREFDDGKRLQLEFEEFPDHVFYLNVTGIDNIIEVLGDDDDNWKGQKIPLQVVKVMNPKTKKMQDVLHVAEAKDWPDLLKGRRPSAPKDNAPQKKTRRR